MIDGRARIHVTDVVMAAVVTIVSLALSPVYYDLVDTITAHAGPLGTVLLELVVPFLYLGIIISVGVSAMRRA